MIYRKDIDGLRALAVLPIVFFHAGFEQFSGGFIGVDIFFVISGFLITSLIYQECHNGKFSVIKFYERRARRILPALFFVILATTVVGYFVLLDEEYLRFGKSAIAALLFIPNVFFWHSTGYFSVDASSSPLLHTWSLGVEEQFYLFFPLLLILVFKLKAQLHLSKILFVLLLMSFILNIWVVNTHATFTFYMLPTRAWELLLGAMLAISGFKLANKFQQELASIIGLLIIILSLFTVTENLPFPGYAASLPVIGTALIILAGNQQYIPKVNQILMYRPFVWVGLISYSLYLWHWPVTVFLNMLFDTPLLQYAIVTLSFFFAVLSFHFIEQPIRLNKHLFPQTIVFKYSFAVTIVLLAICSAVLINDGFPNRLSEEVKYVTNKNNFQHKDRHCHLKKQKELTGGNYCRLGSANAEPSFALIGDSHANAIRVGLDQAAKLTDTAGIQLTTPGCRPLKNVSYNGSERCTQFIDSMLDLVAKKPNIETIFIAGYWKVPYYGHGYRDKRMSIQHKHNSKEDLSNQEVFILGLEDMISTVLDMGKRVVVLGDPPELGFKPRTKYARDIMLGRFDEDNYNIVVDEPINEILMNYISMLENDRVTYVNVLDGLCLNQKCPLMDSDKMMLFIDGDHLSIYGAQKITPLLIQILAPSVISI